MGIYVGNKRYAPYIGDKRRRYMGASGGGGLPYDAEIEYIQSSGTQWIDTGFNPNQDTGVYITILIPTANIISRFYESRNVNSTSEYGLINFGNASNQLQIRYNSRTKLRSKLDIDTVYTLFMDKNNVYLDGTLIGSAQASTFQCNYSLPLFALRNNATISVGDSTYRLYACKIYDNGVLIRDYIPVRVEQTGYLYDQVSGQLFGNSGTGSFILGHDKT